MFNIYRLFVSIVYTFCSYLKVISSFDKNSTIAFYIPKHNVIYFFHHFVLSTLAPSGEYLKTIFAKGLN